MTCKILINTFLRLLRTFLLVIFLLAGVNDISVAQLVPESFGNNATGVKWQKVETAHFKIVFAAREAAAIPVIAYEAEQIFAEYQERMGTTPEDKISIFYNGPDELVSGIRAQDMDDKYSVWRGNPFEVNPVPGLEGLQKSLRLEIAHAFRENLDSFAVDHWYYLFSRPSQTPWSDGLTSYLAQPSQTPQDISVMRNYWYDRSYNITEPSLGNRLDVMLGRSQIHFSEQIFSDDSLREMYSFRQKFLGLISYFDFNTAFAHSYGLPYKDFESRWQSALYSRYIEEHRERFPRRQPVLSQLNTLEFAGVSVHPTKNLIASVSYTDDGNMVQQLHVASPDKQVSKLIDEGYFHSSVDWHPQKEVLAYAKRRYNNQNGQYAYTLQTRNKRTGQLHVIAADKNAFMPSFSPGGDTLAFVERATAQATIWLEHLKTGRRSEIYIFDRPISVMDMDFHPEENKLLISYQQDGWYRAGLLDLSSKSFNHIALQAKVPLNIRWSFDGKAVLFNQEAKQVPNIFRAILDGNELTDVQRITSSYFGTELMDVGRTDSGKSIVLGKVDRDKIFSFRADSNLATVTLAGDERALSLKSKTDTSNFSASSDEQFTIEPYHPFSDLNWETPAVIPYYLNTGEFGFGASLSLTDPMHTHAFDYRGTVSAANPLQSYFYSSYENNSFRPAIEFSYSHLPSASGFFGKSREVQTTDVIAMESLWRLTGLSHDYTDWYFGLTLRHLAFDYFSTETLRNHHPDIFFNNTKTRQTDLKATLAWRKLKPSQHMLIHPVSGTGLRFSVTGSDNVLGSQTQYARFNLDGYKVFPAAGNHRVYIYANGVMDIGEPAGRDYLSFADNGIFQLPDENFLGHIDPDYNRFVRGYDTSLLGDRFLFGKLEYRIPFQFDTNKKLLGIIPPARTVFAIFADGGVMSNARIAEDIRRTEYRYSTGIEMKRVFSIGDSFKITYELGLGQPLTEGFGPRPYFNIRSALPF